MRKTRSLGPYGLSKIRIMISRKILTFAFIGLATVSLSSCTAAGKDAPTSQVRQVTDGVEGEINSVKIRGLLLVAQGDGTAHLIGTFVNTENKQDGLLSVNAGGQEVKIDGANLLDYNVPLIFGGASATSTGTVKLDAKPSQVVPVVIKLGRGGTTTLNALVVEKAGAYANS